MTSNGDVAAERAAIAIERGGNRRPLPDSLVVDQSGGELEEDTIQPVRLAKPPQPRAGAKIVDDAVTEQVAEERQVEEQGQTQTVQAESAEPDPIEQMRTQMELLAQQNLSNYGLDPMMVLTGRPSSDVAAQHTTQTQQIAQPPIIQQQTNQAAQQGFTPQFGIQVTPEEHAAALQDPNAFAQLLVKAARSGYEQGRYATLQHDLPTVTKNVGDMVDKQVEARAFFIENRDLVPYMATVSLVAARLRSTGNYSDSATLLADTAKEVRSTLRINPAAVQAAEAAVREKVNGKTVLSKSYKGAFAGGGRTTTRTMGGTAKSQTPQKLYGDNFADDIAILSSGLS